MSADVAESGSGRRPGGEMVVAVCVKWAALHVEVDPLRGTVNAVNHNSGFSEADRAAVETALRLAEEWTEAGAPTGVVVICVGPDAADGALRDLLACGVTQAVRVKDESGGGSVEQLTSPSVARLLADKIVAIGARFVVCGDVSADRGSGSVPAFLAHRLAAAQALGLIEVTAGSPGAVGAVRRLDGARREILHVDSPAVISVEGAVADLRRATLPATIAARSVAIQVDQPDLPVESDSPVTGPWRPRTRVVAAPTASDALERIVDLTGARSEREPALTQHLEPAEAARAIVDQLDKWGYLGDSAALDSGGPDLSDGADLSDGRTAEGLSVEGRTAGDS